MKTFNRFVGNASGATAIEYSLVAAALSVALVVLLPLLTTGLQASFTIVRDGFANVPVP